jgi:uncharacterized repeat protein (TIGR03843 family)
MPAHELTPFGPLASEAIPDPIDFLTHAEPTVDGRMPWSSNATFLVTLTCGDVSQQAIYKPVRGERPLWDFEPGLHKRERAAYLLSEHLRIGVVPPTVIRDGPFGEGSFQWFVDADHRQHYFTIHEEFAEHHEQLRQIAVLDVLANNTDRKSGHCLLAHDRVWAIDNGLCFSAPFKLRTVIWEFAGEPIDRELLRRVERIADSVPLDIAALLDDDEISALRYRAAALANEGLFPTDRSGHRYPWPLV